MCNCIFHSLLQSENLSRIGGSNVKDIVRRMMYRIFTNEVGMSYSWEGAKKKKIFKNLAIATTILCKFYFLLCVIMLLNSSYF